MRARIWLTLFWLSVSAAAAAALFWTWKHPPLLSLPPPAPSSNAANAATPPAFAPSPLAHYVEIVERPIFIDARRPQVEEAETAAPTNPAAPAPSTLPPLRLVGVVLLPDRAAALLRPEEPEPEGAKPTPTGRLPNRPRTPPRKAPPAKVLRLPQGGTVEGWLLETVQAEKVIFRKDNQVQELALLRPQTPPRPAPPGETSNPHQKPTPAPKTARAGAAPTSSAAAANQAPIAPASAAPAVSAPPAAPPPVLDAAPPPALPATDTVIVAPPADAGVSESNTGL